MKKKIFTIFLMLTMFTVSLDSYAKRGGGRSSGRSSRSYSSSSRSSSSSSYRSYGSYSGSSSDSFGLFEFIMFCIIIYKILVCIGEATSNDDLYDNQYRTNNDPPKINKIKAKELTREEKVIKDWQEDDMKMF